MSILTEEEIGRIDADTDTQTNYARAIESAVLEKLAGMELPWGDDIEAWLEVRTGAEIAAAFHQAYAQGAASVLSAEPIGFIAPHELKNLGDGYAAMVVMLAGAKRTVPVYTLKEPK